MTKTSALMGAAPRAMFGAMTTASTMLRGPQVAFAPDDGGVLTIDQAVDLMVAKPEPEAAPEPEAPEAQEEPEPEAPEEAAEGEPEPEGDPTPEDAEDPENPAIEGEVQEPEGEPDEPAIAAPKSWDAVGRAEFAKLPRATQEIILARETERDKAVNRAHNEAQEARKQAQAELEGVVAFKDKLDQAVTRAHSAFAGKWDGMTPEAWLTFSREDPQAYTIAKAEYDADMAELASAHRAQAEARQLAEAAQQRELQNYRTAEAEKLAEVCPDLADPKEGAARRAKVGTFLLSHGVTHDQLAGISAVEVALAYDAMRYREGQAALKKAEGVKPKPANPQPKTATARTPVPTAAAPLARTSHQRSVEAASAKLKKSGSIDDAVALLLLKGRQ